MNFIDSFISEKKFEYNSSDKLKKWNFFRNFNSIGIKYWKYVTIFTFLFFKKKRR